ncbi:MAG TPA: glycosyltransferase family 2 protein [Nitriliruptorales bacterium]|nr:glycosyltransferase family 2 protein [Nitriliruptorales bacterium]
MLRVVAHALQWSLLALVAYNAVIAMWGWRTPPPAPTGPRRRRFRVVVPAHDEEAVIDRLLTDLRSQDYRPSAYEVVVVADRCTDATARVAARHARVVERTGGPAGKGPALAAHLDSEPLGSDEALVVLDADNRVPPYLLARFADELDAGHQVLQAYLDVANPDSSALATASALTYWASNRSVQLARRNLGWSADLGGTGMCLTGPVLELAGGFGTSPAEDQELLVRLELAGRRVVWLHDVRVRDEKPSGLAVALRQRSRWMAGKREVARRSALPLLRAAARRRSMAPLDLLVRLSQPGRSFLALISGLLAVTAVIARSPLLLPWWLWAAAALFQVAYPLLLLWRERIPARYLLRYPFVTLLAALWLPVRVVSRRAAGWYHTPHRGDGHGTSG